MSLTDDCDDCGDGTLCRKHFLMGVAYVATERGKRGAV